MTDVRTSYRESYQKSEIAGHYEKAIYHPDGFDARLWEAEQSVFKRLLERNVPRLSQACAVDFACGTGRILLFLRPLVGRLTGIDISQAMLDIAGEKVTDTRLVCGDILEEPALIPNDADVITSFRFVLLSEPALRVACIKLLASKLRHGGRMLLNTHGNPNSFRILASIKNRLFSPNRAPLPRFSVTEMHQLAEACGLRVIDAGAVGFIPRSVTMMLPARITVGLEKIFGRIPALWRLGTNVIFVLERA